LITHAAATTACLGVNRKPNKTVVLIQKILVLIKHKKMLKTKWPKSIAILCKEIRPACTIAELQRECLDEFYRGI